MRRIIPFLISILCLAAPTASVTGKTQTQAVLEIRGATGVCTIALSESPSFTPLHPDVNGSEYSGANTDSGRADTITHNDGTRLVTLGHLNDDRALATLTTYYWQVSGCGGTASGSFTTANIGLGSNQQWPVPFNASKPWNMGYPTVSLTNPAYVVDPITGVKIRPLNNALDRTWRTGASPNHVPFSGLYTSFMNYGGGSGWSNLPAAGTNFPTTASTVTTSSTGALDLYGLYGRFQSNPDAPWAGISYDDFALVPWGSCTSTGTACNVTVCIFTSPTAGCLGTPITVTLPGTFGQVHSDSTTDPDFPFPASFPSAFFAGWGLTTPLGPEHVNTSGTLSCTSGVCTIPSLTQFSHFPSTMAAGQRIFIAGSSPACTDNLCTMASYQNAGQVTLSESVTVSGAAYSVFMFGVRIQKANTTGSVTVGAAFKWAGSLGIGQNGAPGYLCNPNGFTSGDGHAGFLCVTAAETNVGAAYPMYFVSSDGTVRSLWNGTIWPTAACYASTNTNDLPNPAQTLFGGQAFPDTSDPKTFYISGSNGAGTTSLYKIVYSGDTTENLSTNYAYDQSGNGFIINSPCGLWSVTNLTPPSSSKDIVSQIANNFSSVYNTSIYGNSASTWALSAATKGYAVFQNTYAGQDKPAWIAIINLSTGLIANLFHTLDGTGTTSYFNGMRWGGLHTINSNFGAPAITMSNNPLGAFNPSLLLSGPFEATPLAVLAADGVTWNTNTSLPWPINTSIYGAVCPSGNPYVFMGATGNNCVTLKLPVGGVCNIAAGATEKAHFAACPWNASYTLPVALAMGDNFSDCGQGGGNCTTTLGDAGDSEHFRIISIATNSDSTLTVVAQRNAIFDYCSFNPTNFPETTINNGVDSADQFQHANGWGLAMYPPRLNGCNTGTFVFNPATGTMLGELGRLLAGSHFEITTGTTPGSSLASFLSSTAVRINRTYDNNPSTGLFALPTTYSPLAGPSFQGQNLNIGAGVAQSYSTSPGGVPWMTDANALNPSFGSGPELNGNSVGSVTLTNVTGNVYTITSIGATLNNLNYKLFPLIGWAGRFLLHDISGPGSSIDSSAWGICFVYMAGECHSGSTAGTLYVNVPSAYNSGFCNTGESFLIAPCVVLGFPSGGGVRQQRITSTDQNGQGSRLLSYLLTSPGMHYPFSTVTPSPDGSFALAAAHHTQGWTTMAWVLKLPPWQEDSTNRTQLGGIVVPLPPGEQYAEIQFGLSRYISANIAPTGNFFCTPRAEGCNTSSNLTGGVPFNYESETRTLLSCSTGCKITIPATAANLIYYRARRSSDGVNWNAQEVHAIAVP